MPVSPPVPAADLLNAEFLQVRAKILELAACLDRFDRAPGSITDDPRVAQIRAGLATLDQSDGATRAERVQMIFSLPYEDGWRKKWSI